MYCFILIFLHIALLWFAWLKYERMDHSSLLLRSSLSLLSRRRCSSSLFSLSFCAMARFLSSRIFFWRSISAFCFLSCSSLLSPYMIWYLSMKYSIFLSKERSTDFSVRQFQKLLSDWSDWPTLCVWHGHFPVHEPSLSCPVCSVDSRSDVPCVSTIINTGTDVNNWFDIGTGQLLFLTTRTFK